MESKKKMRNLLVVLCVLMSVSAFSQEPVPRIVSDLAENFDKEPLSGVGGALAIIHKGKVVYKKVFGHEYANGPAITENTYFALGSVSKAITALVLSDLMAQNKFNLSTELRTALPQIPNGIQVQHVLSHSSGFGYKGYSEIERGRSRKALLTELVRQGTGKQDFIYNNIAFSLVEDLAANELQDTWPNIFHKTLEKRGLGHLAIETLAPDLPVAHPHARHGKKFVALGRLPRNYPRVVSSAAGVFGSLNDLIKFAQLQFSKEFEYLHTPRVAANDVFNWGIKFPVPRSRVRSSYALGWRVIELADDPSQSSRLVFHGGYLNGISAYVGFVKSQDLAVVRIRNDDLRPTSVWSAYLKSAVLL